MVKIVNKYLNMDVTLYLWINYLSTNMLYPFPFLDHFSVL